MVNFIVTALHCLILLPLVLSHALPTHSVHRVGRALQLEPTESIVMSGANVTFICSHSADVHFRWDLGPEVASFEAQRGTSVSRGTGRSVHYSRMTIYGVTRPMSGEISCFTEHERTTGFLIVNGVPNGGVCHSSADCGTSRAQCHDGICDCPKNQVRLRIKSRGLDICKEMIYSLYDPCEFDEQCSLLVDSKSVCKSVCVCASWARDRRGQCIAINEISYNRSQELYRVGLIAVTCVIILIVAVSLWVTLKRSCQEQNSPVQGRRMTITDPSHRFSIDPSVDKPPAYEEILDAQDTFTAPPNFKDALKHCMTAKRLQRQVSAPAGQLLSQLDVEQLKNSSKGIKET